jgi:predicted ester cyclase
MANTGPGDVSLITQVRSLFEDVFHNRQYPLLDDLLAPDFTFQYPFPGFSSGATGIQQFTETFHTALPNFELEIHDLFGNNDRAAIRWTLRGRHSGSFLGINATSRYVSLSAIGIYGGHGRQIETGALEMNTLGMLQQMNQLPPLDAVFPALRQG